MWVPGLGPPSGQDAGGDRRPSVTPSLRGGRLDGGQDGQGEGPRRGRVLCSSAQPRHRGRKEKVTSPGAGGRLPLSVAVLHHILKGMTEMEPESLVGRLLVAMPGMGDPRFAQAVIYMCAHSGRRGRWGSS